MLYNSNNPTRLDELPVFDKNSSEFKKLVEYSELIEDLGENPVNYIFDNADENHAQVIFSNIYKFTKSKLGIYTTGFRKNLPLDEDTFHYMKNLCNCLNSVEECILLVDTISNSNVYKTFKTFSESNPNIKIAKANPQTVNYIRSRFQQKDYHFHFIVGDSEKYRLEFDANTSKAIANFRDKDFTSELWDILSSAYNIADKVR